eukprot:Em0015g479a
MMASYVLLLSLAFLTYAHYNPSGPISQALFDALRKVANSAGTDPTLKGPYLISKAFWLDAKEFSDLGGTWDNCSDQKYSESVILAYMERYATRTRLGRDPSEEDIVRIYHGGPDGWRDVSQIPFWMKVKKQLEHVRC